MLIHAGDWKAMESRRAAAEAAALDLPAEVVDSAIKGAQRRQDEIHRKKMAE
jgi:hypothetical protein